MEHRDITTAFFSQPTNVVANELQSRVIVDVSSGKKVRLERVQPFPSVGKLYKEISNLHPGELWTPYRRTLQSLIVVRKEQDPGSCVRVVRSSYFDEEKQEFTNADSEGQTGIHLGMGRGSVGRLRFQDNTGVLYLIKDEENDPSRDKLPSDEANRQLRDFIVGK